MGQVKLRLQGGLRDTGGSANPYSPAKVGLFVTGVLVIPG